MGGEGMWIEGKCRGLGWEGRGRDGFEKGEKKHKPQRQDFENEGKGN